MRSLLPFLLAAAAAAPAGAEPSADLRDETPDRPDGIHVLDGSYVLNAGDLHVNITNHGLIGSQYSTTLPYANAPSAQWPAGSGDEYLFGAGLWIGARVDGETVVTTGQPERELRPEDDLRATIYEARDRTITRPYPDDRPRGNRLPDALPDDDLDGLIDEDPLNGLDDDGDGLIDEDFGQIGDQMMVCTMHDDLPLVQEIYPAHHPIGVTVIQTASAWSGTDYRNIIALDYAITNSSPRPLEDVYLGFYVDCDIQNRRDGSTRPDDLTGYFDGVMRDPQGTYHRMQVGWMKDAAAQDPLPGVLGVVFLDHDTDFRDRTAPHLARVRSYQSFATNASVFQDGEPQSDEDRYALMASRHSDADARPDRPADFKFLLSSGPFDDVPPGRTLHYRIALVVGNGMDDMLETALRASQLQRGRWFDVDDDGGTGAGGRETKVCMGDYPRYADGNEPLFDYRAAFMDEACVGTEPVFGYELISKEQMSLEPDGRYCIWVNTDNCEECFRSAGEECTLANDLYWSSGSVPTGTGGRETRLPWVYGGEVPPPAPRMRVTPGNDCVDVFWDDFSEHEPDYARGVIDFESYRVWRVKDWKRPQGVSEAQGPPEELWGLIGEWDVVNTIARRLSPSRREIPLGANTGLDAIVYRPVCLDDPRYAGLDEAMRRFVDADPGNDIRVLDTVRLIDGRPRPGYELLLPWERAPAVLDTFFAVTPRQEDPVAGIVAKRGLAYYTYRDDNVRNGFRTFYAVTATDHALADTSSYPWYVYPKPPKWAEAGKGIGADPGTNYEMTVPRFDAQTAEQRDDLGANIYLYPNPVTRDALAEFDRQHPTTDNPTGMQVVFANLPRAHNTIRIYTASGDLVEILHHDGTGAAGGSQAWNMVSRNGQEITSGIYFFVVQSDGAGFEDVVGRFVVVW
ncbi:MAG: hypothetical protein IH621_09090 [Krumholzibacteria bacterium]|nr:hypothetical protein [Candidatus Krumholzibacteria bacterium]